MDREIKPFLKRLNWARTKLTASRQKSLLRDLEKAMPGLQVQFEASKKELRELKKKFI